MWFQLLAVAVGEPFDLSDHFLIQIKAMGAMLAWVYSKCQEIKVSFLQDPEWQLYVDKACLPNNSRAERKVQAWE